MVGRRAILLKKRVLYRHGDVIRTEKIGAPKKQVFLEMCMKTKKDRCQVRSFRCHGIGRLGTEFYLAREQRKFKVIRSKPECL